MYGCLNALLRNPMTFWTEIAVKYGGVARVPLKGRHVYLISDPKLLYDLLVTNRNKYRKNVRYKAAIDTFGAGLLLNEGEAWKRQRRITQAAFKPSYVSEQMPAIAARSRQFLESWSIAAQRHETRDVHKDFFDLSQILAGHYLLGPGFAAIETEFGAAAKAIQENWPLPPRNLIALMMPKGKARERRLDAAIARIDQCLFDYLADQRKHDFSGCGVLEVLVHASRAQHDEFDDQSLRDQLLTLFFAGHETSATSLSWIHYLLSQHSDVREKLQLEVARVLGNRLDPTPADLDQLDYTEQVINESLRLYSPIHSISRVALEDDEIGGYRIPKGAMIYISLYATQRLPNIWTNPDVFDPDRFTPEATSQLPRFAFIPFAAGHRNCIGVTMAMAELKVVIAQIAQRFVLDLAPGHRVVPAAGTTMHPKFGMQMRLSSRTIPS